LFDAFAFESALFTFGAVIVVCGDTFFVFDEAFTICCADDAGAIVNHTGSTFDFAFAIEAACFAECAVGITCSGAFVV
jgi:hypothetical protein